MKDVFQVRKHEQALRRRLQSLRRSSSDTTSTVARQTPSGHISPTAQIDSPTDGSVTEIHSPLDESLIFERSVVPAHSRSQSFSSISSIPAHLSQEAMVPSVLDATCSMDDDAASVEVICGHSGHPLCKRRTTSFSGLSFRAVEEEKEEEGPPLEDVDYSDHTRLNFTSFAELLSDEEDARSPVSTRKNSVVVVPLSVKSTNQDLQGKAEAV